MDWTVTHSCGHTERHMILAQFAYQGEIRAKQLKRRKCTTCYRADKETKTQAQAALDDLALADITLPPLTGSERQIAWALNIRREHIAAAVRKDPQAAVRLLDRTEAKWWIDNRFADLIALMPAR